MEEKIKIAVDSCVIIALSRVINNSLNKDDKAVIDCLKRKALTPDLYKNIPHKYLPPILKDNFLGYIEIMEDGRGFYNNLQDIYRLYEMIENGRCEIYITPTVFGELDFEWYKDQIDFINKYVNVIEVTDEDADAFYKKRDNLAWEYVRKGAMKEEFNASIRTKTPQNDAYVMAEASLCGLVLVTINNKDFINLNKLEEDYQRSDIIKQVNRDFGLSFNSNVTNYMLSPEPYTLNKFILRSKYRRNGYTKPYYIVNPKVEDNMYKSELSQ